MALENQLKQDFEKIAKNDAVEDINKGCTTGKGCTVEWTLDASSQALTFDDQCQKCIEESAKELFGHQYENLTQSMISGAGHDSVFTSKRAPTSMVFVPCLEGISHNPSEHCTLEDCALGAQVLIGAVLRYDRIRTQEGQ